MKPHEKTTQAPPPVVALERGLNILEKLAADVSGQGVALSQLAREMALKTSTTHNLVKTLQLCGYAQKSGAGRYKLGWKACSLVRPGFFDLDPDGPTAGTMRQMAELIGEDVVLATLVGGRRIVVLRTVARQAVRIDPSVADSSAHNIWSVVTGRVMAAYCTAEELEGIVSDAAMPGRSWDGIASRKDLDEHLAEIRTAGLAEQLGQEVSSIAAPVLSPAGGLVGAVGVFLPSYRYFSQKTRKTQKTEKSEKRDRIVSALRDCCKTLSRHAADSTVVP